MKDVLLFTSINYERQTTHAEQALSLLSNYFYLGGAKVTIIEKNKADLDNATLSLQEIALKVSSYILFFPLTLILFTTYYIVIKNHHQFEIVNKEPRNENTNLPEQTQEMAEMSSTCVLDTPSIWDPKRAFNPETDQFDLPRINDALRRQAILQDLLFSQFLTGKF